MIHYNIKLEHIPDSPFKAKGDWRITIDFKNGADNLVQIVQWGTRNELLIYLIKAVCDKEVEL